MGPEFGKGFVLFDREFHGGDECVEEFDFVVGEVGLFWLLFGNHRGLSHGELIGDWLRVFFVELVCTLFDGFDMAIDEFFLGG
jgi:hypothetical protein